MFSDFSLISNFFTLTPLKNISKISSIEYILHDSIINSDYKKKAFIYFQIVSLKMTYMIPNLNKILTLDPDSLC